MVGAFLKPSSGRKVKPIHSISKQYSIQTLERVYKHYYYIIRGGLLISSMLGISERTTMDMDTTVRGISMEEEEIVSVVKEILSVDVDDGIKFMLKTIEPIREDDAYNNFRVHLTAQYGKINAPMKIDITTGDTITPAAVQYSYPLSFEERSIPILAYTLETVLAEKYETIIRRNIGTTRARDFYDLHMLYQYHKDEIRMDILKTAVLHTARKRGSLEEINDWKEVLHDIREEPILNQLWKNYTSENSYASKLAFSEVLDTVDEIASGLNF